jgi:hypothetical protein
LNIAARSPRRRAAAAALTGLVCAALSLLLALDATTPNARAAVPDNQMLCRGHIGKATPDPNAPELTQVGYRFACANPISGYILVLDHQVSTFETEVFALDGTTKQAVPTDSFSCFGDLPGWTVNCTGTYGGNWEIVPGRFAISEKLCDEPRVNPILYVVRATVVSGKPAQAIAGPFDLGRPQACPKSARNGRTHIPSDTSDATVSPALETQQATPATAVKKSKARTKSRRSPSKAR